MELREHSLGKALDVVEIRHVKKLSVDPLHPRLDVDAQAIHDFVRCTDERTVGTKFTHVSTYSGRTSGDLCVVTPYTQRERRRVRDRVR